MKRVLLAASLLFSGAVFSEFSIIQDANTLSVKTPSFHARKTAKIKLKNGLEAYIISDPNIEQSAAAMAVRVGSWNDPAKYPGTAHFTEHLLFLGTEAYPEEDGFMKYIQEHGGSVNAYTASDRTVYLFSVNNDSFSPAFDQFAHMFIDPLFQENGIERELMAVDQENDKNREHDGRRELQVLKEIADHDHPFSKFGTGDANTLGNIPRSEVIAWHDQFYGANNAHLVVYSNKELETLLQLVDETFSKMPTTPPAPREAALSIFPKKELGNIVYIKPVMDLKELNVYWELPIEYVHDTDFKTAELLGYVLSSKGPSSLYAQLRSEGLIDDLGAGPASLSRESGVFSVYFSLTEMGTQHVHDIIERLYQTLASIRKTNIPPYIFNEIRTMHKINYEFQSKQEPYSYVSNTIAELVNEPLATYPMKTRLPTVYEPKRIHFLLDYLKPDQALYVALMHPQFSKVSPDTKERWHHVEYAVKKVPEMQLRAWSVASPHPMIAIQKPNPYLPKQLNLCSATAKEQTPPTLLYSERIGKLYFAQDHTYLTPTVAWNFAIKTPRLRDTADASAMTDLFLESLHEQCLSTEFYARSAGLGSSVSKEGFALTLSVSGYSDKAFTLLKSTLANMKGIETSERDFALFKESLLSEYENKLKNQPYLYARANVRSITSNDSHSPQEMLHALRNIQYRDYKEFEKHLFDEVYVEGMVVGNMDTTEGAKIWHLMSSALSTKPYLEEDHLKRKFLSISNEAGPYQIHDTTQMQGNVSYLLLQGGPFSFEAWASHAMLGKMLNPDFFETLRTKQQTGYIAMGSTGYIDSELVQLFLVQSTTHQPVELLARFELFLEEYTKQFQTLIPKARFEENKAALLESLKTPATNISELCAQYVEEAFVHEGNFSFKEQQIEAVSALTYEQFKKDALSTISRSNGKRLAYLLQGAPLEGKTFQYLMTDAEDIKASSAYVSWK